MTNRSHFRTDIQGLRAIAVALVVLYHAGVPFLTGGFAGVDVFFVISGFLITSHLLRSLETSGRIGFADFYARRARRILPASLTVVVLTVIAAAIFMPPLALDRVFQGAIATALYVPNMLFAAQGTNYLSETAPSVFQHYWSLGIEEQFYLFWPAILMLAFLAFRRSRRGLFIVVVTLTVVSFILGLVLSSVSQPIAFFTLPTRAWELGAGGIIAFLLAKEPSWAVGRVAAVGGWIGVAGLVASAFVLNSSTLFPGYAAALPVIATGLVIIGGTGAHRWSPFRALSIPPMLFIGEISYSLYLVHWPLLVIPQEAVGREHPLPLHITLLLGLLAVPLAVLLNRLIENPLRKAGFLSRARPRRTLFAALIASVAIVGLTGGASLVTERMPLNSGIVAAPAPGSLEPAGTGFVPSNVSPDLQKVSDDNPSIYADDCHRRFDSTDASGCHFGTDPDAPEVVLFGDSHAAQWFPALDTAAESGEIRLDSNTKSSCPSVDLKVLQGNSPYKSCNTWRDGVVARLNAHPPDLIILSNDGAAQLVGGNANYADRWQKGVTDMIDSLPSGVPVIVIHDTPNQGATPAICLSAHLDDTTTCDATRKSAINKAIEAAETAGALAAAATPITMNDYICNESTCPNIIGNVIVYRDSHHLTATFSSTLSDALYQRIKPFLPAR
ncbi:hypothetical protein B7R54_03395 [Subtercola boreus]|uniref:Acyltransferase n=1 Tax=Subtercola boreus TaxID=120213 RepID=A0A3E0VEM4_9MICO|nr:acyltransferase family protein [Subtercola boreus]RFA08374.1 hypothetical protein B7R54_03395 [Subtercola boreus]TQL54720.1 peptidoglycan/LPS O-acetylase OafA/YrhL [Subtercola boreus]